MVCAVAVCVFDSPHAPQALDHVYVTVASFAEAEPWYDVVMVQVLGCRKGVSDIDGDRHCHYITPSFNLAIREAKPCDAAGDVVDASGWSLQPHNPWQPGLHHLCVRVHDAAAVDRVAAALTSLGIAHSAPKEYGYADGYYAVFCRDPNGVRIEVGSSVPACAPANPNRRRCVASRTYLHAAGDEHTGGQPSRCRLATAAQRRDTGSTPGRCNC